MSKKPKPRPLHVDKFAEKYNKPDNIFLNVQATRPAPHPFRQGQAMNVPCILQIVILPNGKIAGRIVG